MADLLQSGATWLASVMKASASQTVTYRRGPLTLGTLKATLGSQLLKTSDGKGSTKTERTDRDFIFTSADLILGGSAATPQRGDQVDLTLGGVRSTYEVMSPGGTEAPWRYCDGSQVMIRVHTKFVRSVAV